jgi:hypothetical protein
MLIPEEINKMENKDLQNSEEENNEAEILRNDGANPNDSAVVVEEEDRTVLLTEDETLIIEKDEEYSLAPSNRKRKVYAGMWGIPEMVTVALATLPLIILLFIYLFFVLPSQQTLEENRAKRDTLEKELITLNKKYGDMTDTETKVKDLIKSVSNFESRFLKNEAVGKSAIYQRLNGLINAYSLTNTTGPDYVPLEVSEDERRRGTETEGQRGRTKFQSLFPGVYVTMTVEGSYLNLRGFIREIERSNEFIVISSIELEPAEDNEVSEGGNTITVIETNAQGEKIEVRKPAPPRGKVRGKLVSLRLEMAAYFQRDAAERRITDLTESSQSTEDNDKPDF